MRKRLDRFLRQYNKKDKKTGEHYTRWGWDFYDEKNPPKRHRVTKYYTKSEAKAALEKYRVIQF